VNGWLLAWLLVTMASVVWTLYNLPFVESWSKRMYWMVFGCALNVGGLFVAAVIYALGGVK
jgi:uncharacterized membrane protein